MDKPERKRLFGRPRSRWDYSIKTYLKDTEWRMWTLIGILIRTNGELL
jgi:hypothetical protein